MSRNDVQIQHLFLTLDCYESAFFRLVRRSAPLKPSVDVSAQVDKGEVLGNQLPVLSQKRSGRDDGCNFSKDP